MPNSHFDMLTLITTMCCIYKVKHRFKDRESFFIFLFKLLNAAFHGIAINFHVLFNVSLKNARAFKSLRILLEWIVLPTNMPFGLSKAWMAGRRGEVILREPTHTVLPNHYHGYRWFTGWLLFWRWRFTIKIRPSFNLAFEICLKHHICVPFAGYCL